MYGRCETDPFDQATDVCDSCYGEFCSACVVTTKGRKHPICRECAIIASGVRPGAKPLLRGSKKTAAKRRKTLRNAPPAPRSFEYFDDRPGEQITVGEDHQGDPTPSPVTVEPEPEVAPAVHGETPAPADDQPTLVSSAEPPAILESRGADEPAATGVSPGLAALAKHQADRRQPEVAPESVPAPEWLTESIDETAAAAAPADSDRSTLPSTLPSTLNSEPADPNVSDLPNEQRGADDKPVTDGYEWVTEMPARGSSTPLPSRSGATTAPTGEPAAGAVATADRPEPTLPKRRSKLRPTVDSS